MKQGKRPTRRQKEAITTVNLTPANWLVYKADTYRLHLVHRYTNTKRSIPV